MTPFFIKAVIRMLASSAGAKILVEVYLKHFFKSDGCRMNPTTNTNGLHYQGSCCAYGQDNIQSYCKTAGGPGGMLTLLS